MEKIQGIESLDDNTKQGRKVIAGCDHAGLELIQVLVETLRGWEVEVEEFGCHGSEPVDYPDPALAVARRVRGSLDLGLLICGSGIGMSIAANKVDGVRAALCHDPYSSEMSRRHNDANIICMGSRVVGYELAKATLRAFLDARYEGGRHQRRLDKIAAIEVDAFRW
jgi:ribose 5-phosphate isomerase B